MSEQKTRYDLTSADTKIIGFEFQYFYFINELLKLDRGQTIGFEVKDDVHIDIQPNKQVLIQLKHTTKKNAQGLPGNLTEKDDDLWKSLSNWYKVIVDNGRNTIGSQQEFIQKTEFIFATNKQLSRNKVISQVSRLTKRKISISDFEQYLSELKNETEDKNIKQHINDILKLNSKVIYLFMKKTKFVDTGDNLINEIKINIQKKMIADNRINDVFNDLYSELKQDFFISVKKGFHQVITFEDWISKYTCLFEKHRQTLLPVRRFEPIFPDNLSEQKFIKELIEIGEVDADHIVQIAELSEQLLMIKMNIDYWHTNGEITNIDKQNFHKNTTLIWRNSHKKAHRTTKKDLTLDKDNALNCLDDVRDKNLKLLNTELDIELSNGEFYYLSNISEIGWKVEWERKYSNGRNT